MTSLASLPALSVVICTRERPDDLEFCLRALRQQTLSGFEVVVVDNAPRTDKTQRVAAAHDIRRVVELRPGLDRARNAGIEATRAGIVAFTDDDAVPEDDWAARIVRTFEDPTVGGVAGPMLPLELETPAQRTFEQYLARMTRSRPRDVRRVYDASFPAAAAGQVGAGANMAFRRELLDAVGGFDEAFDAGMPTRSGGDTDMFARAIEGGWQLVYEPSIRVRHRHRRTDAELRRQLFGYGVGVFALWTKRLQQGDRYAFRLAAGTLWWHLAHRLPRALLRTDGEVPPSLVVAEMLGSVWGPMAYWQSRRLAGAPAAQARALSDA